MNAAQSAAIVQDLLSKQLHHLHKQAVANPNIDMARDWKMLTILIGANNVCNFCNNGELEKRDNADKFEETMRQVLTQAREYFPRMVVNLVQMFNVSQV